MENISSRADVVLGHGSGLDMAPDGSVIELSLESARVTSRAVQLLYEGRVQRIIFSGRGPIHGADYEASEARLMADLAIREGAVNHKLIEIEDQSTSTLGNWVGSVEIMQGLGLHDVIGVSRRLQVPRARLTGKFVTQKVADPIEIVGYEGVAERSLAKTALDIGREAASSALLFKFMHDNPDTPLEDLTEAYEATKAIFNINAFKQRGSY